MCTCMHVYLHIRHTCVRFQKTAHIPSKEIGDTMYIIYIYIYIYIYAVYICIHTCSFFRFQKTAKNCYIGVRRLVIIYIYTYILIIYIYIYICIYVNIYIIDAQCI
jgi:hypothetical protein